MAVLNGRNVALGQTDTFGQELTLTKPHGSAPQGPVTTTNWAFVAASRKLASENLKLKVNNKPPTVVAKRVWM